MQKLIKNLMDVISVLPNMLEMEINVFVPMDFMLWRMETVNLVIRAVVHAQGQVNNNVYHVLMYHTSCVMENVRKESLAF